jgi:hypothetical protein
MGIVGTHPAVFVRVASKGLTGYGTWKSAQRIENKGFANELFARKSAPRNENREKGVRHPAVFTNAHSKGITSVTVCKCGF